MTIIVEDGSIVANANSYVTEAELTTYATARGVTLTTDTEVLLIKAMDYIESLSYKGVKRERDQPLQWPRFNVCVDGYYLESTTIPEELKNGLMQTAIAIEENNDPLQVLPRNVKREKTDVIEVEYFGGNAVDINRKIRAALWKLLSPGNAGNNIRINKA